MDSLQEKVKVTMSELRPNMILAKDAVSKSGVVILAKNTKLDNINYKKLIRNEDILSVEIWDYSIDKRNKPFLDASKEKKQDNIISEREKENPELVKVEFKKFHETYDKKIDELKGCVDALKQGEDADQKQLYSIVDSIISTANCSSDLVHYISYLDKMDDATYVHSINVAVLSNICAMWLRLDKEDIEKAAIAGLLHDIGKETIDLSEDEILTGETLTGEKLAKFKKHPEIGYEMLLYQELDDDIKQAVLNHHEKIDGSGYPNGLKGGDLDIISKIVAVCNEYDNLISFKKRCPFDIINDFESINIGLLDTKVLLEFTKNIAYTYVSSYVKLSNGKTAQVAFINQNYLSRPIVALTDGTAIDLAYNKDIKIVSMA